MSEIVELKKKGSNKWSPMKRLVVRKKDPNKGYRWCDEDEMNIEKKLAEGWHFVNKVTGEAIEVDPESDAMTGVKQHRELILMAQDKEFLEERKQYFDEQADRMERGIIDRAAAQAPEGMETHGKHTIE